MKKPVLILIFLSLIIASLHGTAFADETAAAKFVGKSATNPNRSESDATVGAKTLGKAGEKSIGSGYDVGVYDVWFDFQRDNDGDGYHQQFDVFFDIDSRYNNTRIYVTGQLNNGNSTPLFRTDTFTINGATGNDTYSATVLLTQGYPSAQYDLTLKIYDAQTNALLLTWGPQQDYAMSQLFLEDASRDASSDASIQVFEFSYTLQIDNDGDGYYTEADVRIDVDAPQQTRNLYASLFLIDSDNIWIPLKNSAVFTVSGYSAFDKIDLDFALDSGFDPQRYRLAVELYDASSHNILLTSTTPDSTPVRMESEEYDNDYYVVDEYYVENHHAGGAAGAVLLTGLLLLLGTKRLAYTKRKTGFVPC